MNVGGFSPSVLFLTWENKDWDKSMKKLSIVFSESASKVTRPPTEHLLSYLCFHITVVWNLRIMGMLIVTSHFILY